MHAPSRLILASGSPRRFALLGELGVPFDVIVSDASESVDAALSTEKQAIALANRKARVVASTLQRGHVLGADTIVTLNGWHLGKPANDEDAACMLRRLSGKEHHVVTGLAFVDAATGASHTSAVVSSVRLRSLDEDEIVRYVASGEPRDKAGAYAIQGLGAALIAGFRGCYTNVVGLPLCETVSLLTTLGYRIPAAAPVCRLPDRTPCPRLV